MSDMVLVGPFWTRAKAAGYLGITPGELVARDDVLRLHARWFEETYPSLQFSNHEVRYEIAAVVQIVGEQLPGSAIADWLTRTNASLGATTPLEWFNSGQDLNTALNVAQADVEAAANRVPDGPPMIAAAVGG